MSDQRLRVEAGPHPRRACPVGVRLDMAHTPADRVVLTDTSTGQHIPGQWGGSFLYWIVDRLDAGEERDYIAHFSEGPAPETGVEITQASDEKIDITISGKLFTSYYFGSHLARPYCYPINDPLGASVTRANVGEKEGESTDHKHHRSLFTAYGEANETDNWSEEEGHGYTIHRKFDQLTGGPVFGGLCAIGDWATVDRDVLLHERRNFRFYDMGDAVRVFDVNLTLRAAYGDVHFGDTKEGGLLGVRVATSMDASGDGKIENSYGAISEAECWGRRANWCDYSGPVDDHWAGIAVMEHPDTFRSPTYWHVRDYGLMGTNPFGIGSFQGDPQLSGAYTLPKGEHLTFAYRVVVHTGDATEAQIGNAYHQYISPPQVTVEE